MKGHKGKFIPPRRSPRTPKRNRKYVIDHHEPNTSSYEPPISHCEPPTSNISESLDSNVETVFMNIEGSDLLPVGPVLPGGLTSSPLLSAGVMPSTHLLSDDAYTSTNIVPVVESPRYVGDIEQGGG